LAGEVEEIDLVEGEDVRGFEELRSEVVRHERSSREDKANGSRSTGETARVRAIIPPPLPSLPRAFR
jgi:hypothetical protein